MAKFEVKLPKMGESVAEATITSWLKQVGERVELDEAIVEIATDKVDSEVPSEVEGTLVELLYEPDAVVKVGATIAIIETFESGENAGFENVPEMVNEDAISNIENEVNETIATTSIEKVSDSGKFYSPLVRNIAETEGVSMEQLESIIGSGKDNRVTKNDILAFLESRKALTKVHNKEVEPIVQAPKVEKKEVVKVATPVSVNGGDEIIEMSRMGKLVAHHMVQSTQTSAHVQSFIEVDVTNIVKWRDKVKDQFFAREGEKITFTPIFMQAVAKAIKEFPMINISVDGDKIIKRKAINLGMAAALADGNLIVPVIKNADQLNLVGMTRSVNDLANRARMGKLNPDDIQGGTYTVTNVGSFGSVLVLLLLINPK